MFRWVIATMLEVTKGGIQRVENEGVNVWERNERESRLIGHECDKGYDDCREFTTRRSVIQVKGKDGRNSMLTGW